MTMTSRALLAVFALGAFGGCGDDSASPSDEGSTSADGPTTTDPSAGPTTGDPTTSGGTEDGPTSSTSAEGSTSADAGSSSGDGSDTDGTTSGGDTDGSSSSGGEESSSTGSQVSGGTSTTGAAEPFCGDGFLDDGEECDAGLANDDSSDCTASCFINVCGDGLLNALTESCDDGNDDTSDGCVSCLAASCGDGFTQIGIETCDDSNGDDLDACHNDCSAHEAVELALGADFTCARFDRGSVKCWGNGASGRLGYGNSDTIGDDETPATVGFINFGNGVTAESVVAGAAHTCVALNDGTARCFGAAGVGQLGYGNMIPYGDNEAITSVQSVGLGSAIATIGSGSGSVHTCAALESGDLKCWGQATNGKLGIVGQATNIGDNESLATSPVTDVGATVLQVETGQSHSCARTNLGTVRCWGSQANGATGYGTGSANPIIGDNETPASVGDVGLSDFVSDIAVGWVHSCAVLEDGSVQCWGRGNDGRLGYGNVAYVGYNNSPSAAGTVELDGPARQVAAGLAHSCAMLQDGTVQCWGFGSNGQLGYGNTSTVGDNEDPADAGVVSLDTTVRFIAADGNHTCVITSAGGVRCWGQGADGRLGYGNTNNLGDDEPLSDLTDIEIFSPPASE